MLIAPRLSLTLTTRPYFQSYASGQHGNYLDDFLTTLSWRMTA